MNFVQLLWAAENFTLDEEDKREELEFLSIQIGGFISPKDAMAVLENKKKLAEAGEIEEEELKTLQSRTPPENNEEVKRLIAKHQKSVEGIKTFSDMTNQNG